MLQIRHGDGRVYNPGRDIVQLFPYAIGQTAALRLAQSSWHSAVRAFAEQSGLTEAELVRATTALAKFINETPKVGGVTFAETWAAAGLDKVPPAALLCLFFQVGLVTTGLYHAHARAAVHAGAQPAGAAEAVDLLDRAAHAQTAAPGRARARRAAQVRAAADKIIPPNPLDR